MVKKILLLLQYFYYNLINYPHFLPSKPISKPNKRKHLTLSLYILVFKPLVSPFVSLSLSLYILNLHFSLSISSSIAPPPLFHLHRLPAGRIKKKKKKKKKPSRTVSIFPFFSVVSALFFFLF